MAELYNNVLTFSYDGDFEGVRSSKITEGAPAIAAGEIYTVAWGSRRYICEAREVTATEGDATVNYVCLGDTSIVGGEESLGEPFMYRYNTDGTGAFYTQESENWHEVRIYAGLDNPEGCLMYNRTIAFQESTDGSYYSRLYTEPRLLVEGETYTVVWDGEFFSRTAKTITTAGESPSTFVYVGNLTLNSDIGSEEDTGEPFLYLEVLVDGVSVGDKTAVAFNTNSTAGIHTISIYEGELKLFVENKSLYFDVEASSKKYTANLSNPAMPITAGETYTITWDGRAYALVAKEAAVTVGGVSANCVVLGNISIADETAADTGEPFLYAYCAGEVIDEFELTAVGVYTEALGMTWHKVSDLSPSYDQMLNATFTYSVADPETGEYDEDTVINPTAEDCLINEERGSAFQVGWDGLCVAYRAGHMENAIATIDLPEKGVFLAGPDPESFTAIKGSLKASEFAWFIIPDKTHTVSIVEGDKTSGGGGGEIVWAEPTDVYTYDKDGNPVLHEKRGSITLDTPDGRYAVFKLSHIADSRS